MKANSIEGCKLNKVDIVYTPVGNLRQTNDMDVGQVGFHVDKHVSGLLMNDFAGGSGCFPGKAICCG